MNYGFVEFFTYGATFLITVTTGVLAVKKKKASDVCIFVGFLVISLSSLITLFYYNTLIFDGKPDLEEIEKGLKYSDFIMLSPAIALFFMVVGFGLKLMKREY